MSLTPEGLAKIERKARDKYHDRCFCGLRRGLHVFVLSLLAVPFAWVYATLSAFYIGTLTWEVLNSLLFLPCLNFAPELKFATTLSKIYHFILICSQSSILRCSNLVSNRD